jgi:hypothetical protein
MPPLAIIRYKIKRFPRSQVMRATRVTVLDVMKAVCRLWLREPGSVMYQELADVYDSMGIPHGPVNHLRDDDILWVGWDHSDGLKVDKNGRLLLIANSFE